MNTTKPEKSPTAPTQPTIAETRTAEEQLLIEQKRADARIESLYKQSISEFENCLDIDTSEFMSTLHLSIFMTGVVIISYLLGRFKLSLSLLVGVLYAINFLYKRRVKRFKDSLKVLVYREAMREKTKNNWESVEWMNYILGKFWTVLEPTISREVFRNVNPILKEKCPPFLSSLKLSSFTLGSNPPFVVGICHFDDTETDTLVIESEFGFVPLEIGKDSYHFLTRKRRSEWNSKIILTARLGTKVKGVGIDLPVLVKQLSFRGRARVIVKLTQEKILVKNVEACFMEPPLIDFTLVPLKTVDLMDVPGLSSWIHTIINSTLKKMAVNPNSIKIDLSKPEEEKSLTVGVVLLHITTIYNKEEEGVVVEIDVDGRKMYHTMKKEGVRMHLNEYFYVVVESMDDDINLKLLSSSMGKDNFFGEGRLFLKKITSFMHHLEGVKVMKKGNIRSIINTSMTFYPTINHTDYGRCDNNGKYDNNGKGNNGNNGKGKNNNSKDNESSYDKNKRKYDYNKNKNYDNDYNNYNDKNYDKNNNYKNINNQNNKNSSNMNSKNSNNNNMNNKNINNINNISNKGKTNSNIEHITNSGVVKMRVVQVEDMRGADGSRNKIYSSYFTVLASPRIEAKDEEIRSESKHPLRFVTGPVNATALLVGGAISSAGNVIGNIIPGKSKRESLLPSSQGTFYAYESKTVQETNSPFFNEAVEFFSRDLNKDYVYIRIREARDDGEGAVIGKVDIQLAEIGKERWYRMKDAQQGKIKVSFEVEYVDLDRKQVFKEYTHAVKLKIEGLSSVYEEGSFYCVVKTGTDSFYIEHFCMGDLLISREIIFPVCSTEGSDVVVGVDVYREGVQEDEYIGTGYIEVNRVDDRLEVIKREEKESKNRLNMLKKAELNSNKDYKDNSDKDENKDNSKDKSDINENKDENKDKSNKDNSKDKSDINENKDENDKNKDENDKNKDKKNNKDNINENKDENKDIRQNENKDKSNNNENNINDIENNKKVTFTETLTNKESPLSLYPKTTHESSRHPSAVSNTESESLSSKRIDLINRGDENGSISFTTQILPLSDYKGSSGSPESFKAVQVRFDSFSGVEEEFYIEFVSNNEVVRRSPVSRNTEIGDVFLLLAGKNEIRAVFRSSEIGSDRILGDCLIPKREMDERVMLDENRFSAQIQIKVKSAAFKKKEAIKQGTLELFIRNARNVPGVEKDGMSDPFIKLFLNGVRVHKTNTKKGTVTPVFNEVVCLKVNSLVDILRIEMFDWNQFENNILIAYREMPLYFLQEGLNDIDVALFNGKTFKKDAGVLSLGFRFMKEEVKGMKSKTVFKGK